MLVLDMVVPVVLVGDEVLPTVVEADDVNLVASFTVVVGVGVGAEVVDSALELGAT